jgi:hypothetical protein
MDIATTLEAKSSQLNTDDLIAGPKTITITKVSAGNAEQPVAVSFEGDSGKPWYPCKSMRRVLVAAWGADASQYVGRRVILFRDPSVIYGGIAVGGIRVSHLSHLDSPLSIALTMTRQKRAPYKVAPLPDEPLAAPVPSAGSSEDLLANAAAVCRRSGLTNAGIATFALELTNGNTSDLSDAPAKALAMIVRQGVSLQTVERCNAEPKHVLAAEPGTAKRLPVGQTVVAADPQPAPAPTLAAGRRSAPAPVRRSGPPAAPGAEAPIPGLD